MSLNGLTQAQAGELMGMINTFGNARQTCDPALIEFAAARLQGRLNAFTRPAVEPPPPQPSAPPVEP